MLHQPSDDVIDLLLQNRSDPCNQVAKPKSNMTKAQQKGLFDDLDENKDGMFDNLEDSKNGLFSGMKENDF